MATREQAIAMSIRTYEKLETDPNITTQPLPVQKRFMPSAGKELFLAVLMSDLNSAENV